ncbi:Zn(2)-C6 fungal-type DNA-binding domain [Phaffia rhodozyma]|uniref:Zn(2)-C6 fungal-type DNA-binding domain n=1 Tax=Phaffia rhodozyma TaxID=264483 RepID=A0A0F7SMT1_PHARH|nr:Zn(2)-C6 fungal-type DNA-binding domain [Phaffia rhodozyma]
MEEGSEENSSKEETAPASSLLHLLANASEPRARISASYHLSPIPTNLPAVPTLPRPAGGQPTDRYSPKTSPVSKKRKSSDPASQPSSNIPTPIAVGTNPSSSHNTPSSTGVASGPSGSKQAGLGGKSGKHDPEKAVLSCAECRRLKLKCSREWPCTNCVKRGVSTICPEGELKGGKGKRLILANTTQLHARISALETALDQSHRALTRSDNPHPLLESSYHFEPLDGNRHANDSPMPAPGTVSSGPGADDDQRGSSPERGGTPDSLNGVPIVPIPGTRIKHETRDVGEENVGRLTMGNEPGASRYFGGSAGSAYLLPDDPASPEPSSQPNPSANHTSLQFDMFPFKQDSLGFVRPSGGRPGVEWLVGMLPTREEAWGLSEVYWRNGSWMYDVISKREFDDELFPYVYGSPTVSTSIQHMNVHKLAVFYMVLCLGALFDLNNPPFNQRARRYCDLAKLCLAINPSGSVAYIQAIQLMGSYLLNGTKATSGGEQFWPLLGLAMKHLTAVGLHRDGARWGLDPAEVDMRRRLFWECSFLDAIQSLTFGRPRCLSDSTTDVKYPGSGLPDGQKYEGDVFHQFKTQTSPVTYDIVLAIDRDIRIFERTQLPAELHCGEDSCVLPTDGEGWSDKKRILQRHSMLLIINECLLFLHRGWFARALRDFPDEPLKAKWNQSYVAELESCKACISVVRDLMKLHGALASRWWFFWFHCFSAIASLSVAVIRSPGSSLALAAFQEIELGVSLFEDAKVGTRARDELPLLKRLRNKAEARLRGSALKTPLPGVDADPADSDEDLDLIGENARRKTVDGQVSGSGQQHQRKQPKKRPSAQSQDGNVQRTKRDRKGNSKNSSTNADNDPMRSNNDVDSTSTSTLFKPVAQPPITGNDTLTSATQGGPYPLLSPQVSVSSSLPSHLSPHTPGQPQREQQQQPEVETQTHGHQYYQYDHFPTTLDDAIAAQPSFSIDPNATFGDYASWSAEPDVGVGVRFGIENLFTSVGGDVGSVVDGQGVGEPKWDLDFDAFMLNMGLDPNDQSTSQSSFP